MSSTNVLAGAPAGSAVAVDPAAYPALPTDFQTFPIRSFTMFQALYADLARAHQRRRQREFQRQLERRAQQELVQAMPRLMLR